jgi:phosphate:Na+ symporter
MEIIGGIGLFLLGMTLLTEGLQAMASNKLAKLLQAMTKTKWRGVMFGTAITAFLQSSSAATLLTLGFVNSGLMTFQQSLGVIFGSNLGTTVTAWLISLIGLKFSIKVIALPMIGLGVMLKLMKGRLQYLGLGLCGFGLLFYGIDLLQSGMAQYSALLDLGRTSTDTIPGVILIVLIGAIMSVVMQSSSAAMATTLTALYAEAITFHAAIFLVIGQNIGTTMTAIIGSLGASIYAKRTAYAHLLFNLIAGTIALFLVPLFLMGYYWWQTHIFDLDQTIGLSLFHSLFQLIGIVACLPMTEKIAYYLEKWVKPSKIDYAEKIQRELCVKEITGDIVALELFYKKLIEIFSDLHDSEKKMALKESSSKLLNHLYLYISAIPMDDRGDKNNRTRTEFLRALENIRLILSLDLNSDVMKRLDQVASLSPLKSKIADLQDKMLKTHLDSTYRLTNEELMQKQAEINQMYQDYRINLLNQAHYSQLDHQTLTHYLDTIKNLHQHHQSISKLHHHLDQLFDLQVARSEWDDVGPTPSLKEESLEETQTSLF